MKKFLMVMMSFILIVCPLVQPAQAAAASKMFVSISSSHQTTLALDANGHIWAWGNNLNGQFGDGTLANSLQAKQIIVRNNGVPVRFKEVIVSQDFSLALDIEGNMWSTGGNNHGQLGHGTGTPDAYVWKKLDVEEGGMAVVFKEISITRATSVALDNQGNLWVWGLRSGNDNDFVPTKKTILDGTGNPVVFATLAGSYNDVLAVDSSQHLWYIIDFTSYNPNRKTVTDAAGEVSFKSIDGGVEDLLAAIDINGSIWSWSSRQPENGLSSSSKLIVRDKGRDVKFTQISAGGKHMLALDTNGEMWTWGDNEYG